MTTESREADGAGLPAIGDVGRAFVGASRTAELWAFVVAVVVAPLVSVIVNIFFGLTPFRDVWLTVPFAWLSIADLFFVLLLGASWTAAAILFLPSGIRPAFEAFTWSGERALEAFGAMTGSEHVPTSPEDASAWLERNPESEDNRWARAEVQLFAGELAAARDTVARMAERTPEERIVKADLGATAELVATGSVDLEPMRRLIDEVDGDARLDGIVNVAIMESRLALAAGTDWRTPLATARVELGRKADGILWRGYAVRRLRLIMPIMLLLGLAFGVAKLVLGGLG